MCGGRRLELIDDNGLALGRLRLLRGHGANTVNTSSSISSIGILELRLRLRLRLRLCLLWCWGLQIRSLALIARPGSPRLVRPRELAADGGHGDLQVIFFLEELLYVLQLQVWLLFEEGDDFLSVILSARRRDSQPWPGMASPGPAWPGLA